MSFPVKSNYYLNQYVSQAEPAPQTKALSQVPPDEDSLNDASDLSDGVSYDPSDVNDPSATQVDDETLVFDDQAQIVEPDASASSSDVPHEVTRNQILALYDVLEGKIEENKSEGKDDKDLVGYLDSLKDALRDERDGNEEKAWQEFNSVDAIVTPHDQSMTGDPLVDGVNQPDPYADDAEEETPSIDDGSSPTKISEDGTKYYEANTGKQDFSLQATGEDSISVVTTDGTVTINPIDKVKDKVTVHETNRDVVVKIIHEGKTETIKVSKKASLHIDSENVNGTVNNKYGKITTGTQDSADYIDPAKRKEVGDKIGNTDGIWTGWSRTDWFKDGMGDEGAYNWYHGMFQKRVSDVSEVLNLLSSAVKETDPDAKRDLQDQAVAALGRWETEKTVEGEGTGEDFGLNSRLATLFEMLYSKLGGDGFKDALQSGLIPPDFAAEFAKHLNDYTKSKKGEGTYMIFYHGAGLSGWNPSSMADFVKRYSGIEAAPPKNSTDDQASD